MPFKSKAQMRWMFAAEERGEIPKGTAKRWAEHTKNIDKLPERKRKKDEKDNESSKEKKAFFFDPVLFSTLYAMHHATKQQMMGKEEQNKSNKTKEEKDKGEKEEQVESKQENKSEKKGMSTYKKTASNPLLQAALWAVVKQADKNENKDEEEETLEDVLAQEPSTAKTVLKTLLYGLGGSVLGGGIGGVLQALLKTDIPLPVILALIGNTGLGTYGYLSDLKDYSNWKVKLEDYLRRSKKKQQEEKTSGVKKEKQSGVGLFIMKKADEGSESSSKPRKSKAVLLGSGKSILAALLGTLLGGGAGLALYQMGAIDPLTAAAVLPAYAMLGTALGTQYGQLSSVKGVSEEAVKELDPELLKRIQNMSPKEFAELARSKPSVLMSILKVLGYSILGSLGGAIPGALLGGLAGSPEAGAVLGETLGSTLLGLYKLVREGKAHADWATLMALEKTLRGKKETDEKEDLNT